MKFPTWPLLINETSFLSVEYLLHLKIIQSLPEFYQRSLFLVDKTITLEHGRIYLLAAHGPPVFCRPLLIHFKTSIKTIK